MLLDAGASTNILDKATFDKLSAIKPIALTKSPVKIFAYGSQSPLPVVGKFDNNNNNNQFLYSWLVQLLSIVKNTKIAN